MILKEISMYTINECGDYSVATKRGIVKILHFRQFYKHFVFVENPDGGRKKRLKNYADVNVCIAILSHDIMRCWSDSFIYPK